MYIELKMFTGLTAIRAGKQKLVHICAEIWYTSVMRMETKEMKIELSEQDVRRIATYCLMRAAALCKNIDFIDDWKMENRIDSVVLAEALKVGLTLEQLWQVRAAVSAYIDVNITSPKGGAK